ncbi:hypothetical protein ADEAN_000463000 [Angomonas deanei]|uniref:Uncharacterized protein n=1 Tax=Angomonas deanei TaxID=59799 RepID=A0A7G2CG48_9TRYP|nr:hypothetical protein ADEAN_000463000 [Angomonas deanei]
MKRARLDSDDDDDEYDTAPLSHYPVNDNISKDVMLEMGLESSSSSTASEAPPQTEGDVKAEQPPQKEEEPNPFTSKVLPEDRDFPPVWRTFLSERVLEIYACPIQYITSRRPVDDKLLAQYHPFNEAKFNVEKKGNGLPVKPGGRWDGIVRGRPAK